MNLPAKDLAAAIPFYETIMAFKVLHREKTPCKSAVPGMDSIGIGLSGNGDHPSQDGCFFEVDNVDNAFAELVSNG